MSEEAKSGDYLPALSEHKIHHLGKREAKRLIREMIRRVHVQDEFVRGIQQSRLRLAIERCFDLASEGSLPHLEFIANRTDGKPVQDIGIGESEILPSVGKSLLNEKFDVLMAKVEALTYKEKDNE
jgi:hypothetical protein